LPLERLCLIDPSNSLPSTAGTVRRIRKGAGRKHTQQHSVEIGGRDI
jgi:hypothetical protein